MTRRDCFNAKTERTRVVNTILFTVEHHITVSEYQRTYYGFCDNINFSKPAVHKMVLTYYIAHGLNAEYALSVYRGGSA